MNQIPSNSDWQDSQAETQPIPVQRGVPSSQPSSYPQPPLSEPPPADPLSAYQPIRVPRNRRPPPRPIRRRASGCTANCGCLGFAGLLVLLLLALYFVFPTRTRILLMGIDTREADSNLGRTDTIILMQVNPLRPDVKMLSIPRDLWVVIPGVGENRINTAHFFAEANQPGSGPQTLIDTVDQNFGLRAQYFARVRFGDFRGVIDAMGGLDLNLSEPAGGFEAGRHHLNGEQALAFARDRTSGGDDFARMGQGQIILIAAASRMLNPLVWPRIPAVITAFFDSVDTNLPFWQWPRIALALARAGTDGIDNRSISRDQTIPFTTAEGAQVLGPNWELIRPMINEMFGQ